MVLSPTQHPGWREDRRSRRCAPGVLGAGARHTCPALVVREATGRTVRTQNMNEAQETLDLSNLKNGVYFVRLQQANHRGATLRLVVAN